MKIIFAETQYFGLGVLAAHIARKHFPDTTYINHGTVYEPRNHPHHLIKRYLFEREVVIQPPEQLNQLTIPNYDLIISLHEETSTTLLLNFNCENCEPLGRLAKQEMELPTLQDLIADEPRLEKIPLRDFRFFIHNTMYGKAHSKDEKRKELKVKELTTALETYVKKACQTIHENYGNYSRI